MTSLLKFPAPVPLSLYIHLPWCVKKCPYCDFNSHAIENNKFDDRKYIDAVIRDLEFELPRIWGRRINSVFIGGGTPSLFSGHAIQLLLSTLRALLNLHPETEVTLESNPGTAEAGKFQQFREAGVNRLSIGVQSFNDKKLAILGRIHTGQEAVDAIKMARSAGFENINLDLMYGLPGQTPEQAITDLHRAIDLTPEHVSWYQLTIEPNTVFYSHPPQNLPESDTLWEIQKAGQDTLNKHNYHQYEISAYAQHNYQCAHNTNYWQFGDYLGLGAGAHGKLTDITAGKITRYTRHRLPGRYMELAGTNKVISTKSELGKKAIPLEFMMNALRLEEGVHPVLFNMRTGMHLCDIKNQLVKSEATGMLDWDIQCLRTTDKGKRYLNDLLQIFVTD